MRWAVIAVLFIGLAAPARAEDPAIKDGSAQAALDEARTTGIAGYRFLAVDEDLGLVNTRLRRL